MPFPLFSVVLSNLASILSPWPNLCALDWPRSVNLPIPSIVKLGALKLLSLCFNKICWLKVSPNSAVSLPPLLAETIGKIISSLLLN